MIGAIKLAENGWIPEKLLRHGIRKRVRQTLQDSIKEAAGNHAKSVGRFVTSMRQAAIAEVPQVPNQQHYEIPAEFFDMVLGPHRKYSSCYFSHPELDLEHAEAEMLAITCQRAQIRDGQKILELGCGWGSLSLWLARQYPNSEILSVSNSNSQRLHITDLARKEGLSNLEVLTCDMNQFHPTGTFDRVVSVEMFEHMRNWEELLTRIRPVMADNGKIFLHVFSHRIFAYPFEINGPDDWMARHFFTGGMMPSHNIFDHLDTPFELEQSCFVGGQHYQLTADAWLRNIDERKGDILPLLSETYDSRIASTWVHRWRLFFIACSELFGYEEGKQWGVSHHLLKTRP